MIVLYSPLDVQNEQEAFNQKITAITQTRVCTGGLMLYIAAEKINQEGVSSGAVALGSGGGLVMSYTAWSTYKKMQGVLKNPYRFYGSTIPKSSKDVIEGPKVQVKINKTSNTFVEDLTRRICRTRSM